MANLTEEALIAQYIGGLIHTEHFAKCATKNGDSGEYIVYSCGYLYKPELCEAFGVTDKLKDLWERRGTEFNIYLCISDGYLTSARIFKYTESGGARPSISTPKCTQQELRIARRILSYVTQN